MHLVVGLHPDPLGELQHSPRRSSHNWGRGPTSKGKGRERKGRRGRVRGGDCLLYLISGYRPV